MCRRPCGGGPCDFSVTPSPYGLDFGTLDSGLRTWAWSYFSSRFSQIGIVSWGLVSCLPGNPSAFARVSEYKEWIKSVASGTQDSNCWTSWGNKAHKTFFWVKYLIYWFTHIFVNLWKLNLFRYFLAWKQQEWKRKIQNGKNTWV